MFRKTLRQLQPLGDILRKTTVRANTKDAVQRMLSANMDKFTDAAQSGQGECTVEFDTKRHDLEIFQQVMTSNQLDYKLVSPTKVTVVWSPAEEKRERRETYAPKPVVKAPTTTSATQAAKPKVEKKEEAKKVEAKKEDPKKEEKKEEPILGKKWQRGEDGTYTFQLQ
jgi:hypothetical protein